MASPNARMDFFHHVYPQGGYQAAQQMLQGKSLPRAIFATNETQAIGCIRALAEHNISVPADMALVCFNGTEQSAFHVPSLTTVRQPVAEMAKKRSQC